MLRRAGSKEDRSRELASWRTMLVNLPYAEAIKLARQHERELVVVEDGDSKLLKMYLLLY